MRGVYAEGLAGWEVRTPDDGTDRLAARWTGDSSPERLYRIQHTPGGRAFIRPFGRRIWLDQILVTGD